MKEFVHKEISKQEHKLETENQHTVSEFEDCFL